MDLFAGGLAANRIPVSLSALFVGMIREADALGEGNFAEGEDIGGGHAEMSRLPAKECEGCCETGC